MQQYETVLLKIKEICKRETLLRTIWPRFDSKRNFNTARWRRTLKLTGLYVSWSSWFLVNLQSTTLLDGIRFNPVIESKTNRIELKFKPSSVSWLLTAPESVSQHATISILKRAKGLANGRHTPLPLVQFFSAPPPRLLSGFPHPESRTLVSGRRRRQFDSPFLPTVPLYRLAKKERWGWSKTEGGWRRRRSDLSYHFQLSQPSVPWRPHSNKQMPSGPRSLETKELRNVWGGEAGWSSVRVWSLFSCSSPSPRVGIRKWDRNLPQSLPGRTWDGEVFRFTDKPFSPLLWPSDPAFGRRDQTRQTDAPRRRSILTPSHLPV